MVDTVVTFLTTNWLGQAILILLECLAVTVPLLVAVAYMTYVDRKVWASIQLRRGPNVVGPFGLLQPFADGLKLVLKETIVPSSANTILFLIAPMITFITALIAWAVVPFDDGWVIADLNVGILYLFAISSLGVYGIIIAGWASNSKYAFLGALRSAAQMVSYEVSIGFVLVTVLLCVGSLNLSKVVLAQSGWFWNWFWLPLLPMFVIYFVSALAETNRTPFDLPMSEAELVQGFQTEYSSMPFALFFLGEYANMILLSGLGSILFLGGWMSPIPYAPFTWIPGVIWFALKIALLLFVFSWTKGTLPRYRYDQLMRLGWKVFLPVSLGWVVLTAAVLQFGGWVPKH
jgi:NADH-quinone oxidoreductase subunit H